ncbi:MAG: glycoside hydrolase family 127 protein, partial [Candidatus Saccharimonadales bacterium]
KWKRGDRIELKLPMPVKLIEANPLVEATRNQVAVKRGPVVYCLESIDIPKGQNIFNIAIPAKIGLKPRGINIDNTDITALEGRADLIHDAGWKDRLYRPVSSEAPAPVHIQLIPYFAWGNRGHTNMTVWMPLDR